jgi:hypothetical protein
MHFGKIAPLIALSLLLTGCLKEQRQAMASCSAKVPFATGYPAASTVKTPVVLCMKAAGYLRDFNNDYCRVEALPRRSPFCYRPKGFFLALGYRIEMLGHPGPKPPMTDIDHPQISN